MMKKPSNFFELDEPLGDNKSKLNHFGIALPMLQFQANFLFHV